jgi:predicted lysophospholipase L1 biosynthesis ABC-type transport system permease subunit
MGSAENSHEPWVRIAGICADVSYSWIDRETEPSVYLNVAQMPPAEGLYIVSTSGDPLSLAPSARQSFAALDLTVPLDSFQTYQHYLNEALAGLTYVAAWLTIDAFVGLLLAAIGIFGVMANVVAERTREIGLRMAMGASPHAMLRMVLRRAALLAGVGIAAGVILAAGVAQFSASLLFGVSPHDPAIFISITLTVAAVTLLASWAPARRAASIDPMRALRTE